MGTRPPPVPQSERELEQFFDLSLDLLCIAGFDGYFKRVNAAFERTLGYSTGELLSRPFLELVDPADLQRSRDVLAYLETGKDVVGFETDMVCADGSVRTFEWNTHTMPERGIVYGIARDVTERRRADAEQAALRRVATVVAQGAAPQDVFATVAEEAGRLLGVGVAMLVRYEDDGTATVVAAWGEDGVTPVGTRLPVEGENLVTRVRRTGRSARIGDYEKATGAIATLARRAGIRSAVGAPIVAGGRLWGAMLAMSRAVEPLPRETMERIGEFAELVAAAISNAEARSELAASRARIVAAADEERRRVVRDLHDGAQARLVHTVVTLNLARRALDADAGDAGPLLAEAAQHAEQATTELRELSHGILPAALVRHGLPAGVEALASRSQLPVEIDVSVDRLPAAIEATAYFVVAEALTNVAKHARARSAAVSAHVEDGCLSVRVRDDGVGGARREGSGLIGLADRLAALDGRLAVESPPEGGTLIEAVIPLPG
jgi:PAS domain S-box-containing protein